jgi:hypothetical protein
MWTGARNGSESHPQPTKLLYHIIGADSREYGPVSLDQLKQWLNEGRLNPQSRVRAEDSADWMALGDLPEFKTTLTPAFGPPQPVALPSAESVKQRVAPPAIFILVLSALNIMTSMIGLLGTAFGGASGLPPVRVDNPDVNLMIERTMSISWGLPLQVPGILIAITCLIGSLMMLNLKSYVFAMVTAILTLLPLGSCCCFLNIGAGVWALIVLSKPEVKAAFR